MSTPARMARIEGRVNVWQESIHARGIAFEGVSGWKAHRSHEPHAS